MFLVIVAGLSDDPLPPGASAGAGETSNRLQTLAANRGILRDVGPSSGAPGDKRGGGGGGNKPDVITIDDPRRGNEGGKHSPSSSVHLHPHHQEHRFHPATQPGHHHPLTENNSNNHANSKDPNLTAGSLIDVIITRQISNNTDQQPGSAQQSRPPNPTSTASQQQSRPTLLPKRELPDLSVHKPFTLGEHIEQIIASDFSRKESLGVVGGGGGNGHLPPGMTMGLVGSGGVAYPQYTPPPSRDDAWKPRGGGGRSLNELPAPSPSIVVNHSQQISSPFPKPSGSSVASAVVYEQISPANSRDNSESGDDEPGKSGNEKWARISFFLPLFCLFFASSTFFAFPPVVSRDWLVISFFLEKIFKKNTWKNFKKINFWNNLFWKKILEKNQFLKKFFQKKNFFFKLFFENL